MHIVEQATKFMGLGREVYTTGIIRKKTIFQAIQIFLAYKELLKSYSLTPNR